MKRFDVFLSYNQHDEAWVKQLKASLVALGLKVWLACDEIQPGELFPHAIERGITDSAALALIVSPQSIASKWVHEEYNSALVLSNKRETDLTIIPLLLQTVEMPVFLQSREFVDFREAKQYDDAVERLAASLRTLLSADAWRVRKVTFVSSEYPPSTFGGLGIHVQKLTGALAKFMDVDVLLPKSRNGAYQELTKNVHPTTIPVDASYEDTASWCRFATNAIWKMMLSTPKTELPDVIHCHDWVTVLVGIKCRWALNIPFVFHVHLPNRNPLCASIENLGLVSADMVTVNSAFMSVELNDRRLPIRKLRVVKNGVDMEAFRPSPAWPSDGGYILFVGRLVEQKGVEYLLRAFSYVHQKFPDVRLKIVGQGEFGEWLERLAINLSLSTHVEFLPWAPHEQLSKFYQEARVVAVPSIFEPFGMVALEAMACKRPVIASNTGGLSEIVQDGKTGYLFQPKDYLDLAQWMMTLLSNESLQRTMGETAYNTVSNHGYTWLSIAEQFNDLYGEVREGFKVREAPPDARTFIEQILEQALTKDEWDWRRLLYSLYSPVA